MGLLEYEDREMLEYCNDIYIQTCVLQQCEFRKIRKMDIN